MKRWRPKVNEVYYLIHGELEYLSVCSILWEDDSHDWTCFNNHNCFKTAEEARAKMHKILEVLWGKQTNQKKED